jgi:hypothetical protein
MLALNVLEMKTGPFRFLIVQGVPVAYHDARPDAPAPGLFASARQPGVTTKAMTKHKNTWLRTRFPGQPYATVPPEQVHAALDSVSVYGPKSNVGSRKPSEEEIAATLEYMADLARRRARRTVEQSLLEEIEEGGGSGRRGEHDEA